MNVPNKETEPYTYNKWERLGMFELDDTARVIMWELYHTFITSDWLFQSEKPTWETEDMRKFAEHLSRQIKVNEKR